MIEIDGLLQPIEGPVPVDVSTALHRLVEHWWEDMEFDYFNAEAGDAGEHPYFWLTIVRRWMESYQPAAHHHPLPDVVRSDITLLVRLLEVCDRAKLFPPGSQSESMYGPCLERVRKWLSHTGTVHLFPSRTQRADEPDAF